MWRWKDKRIEEIREFCYLGYVFRYNGKQDGQIRERMRKEAAVLGQIWRIEKRRFGGNWGKRL